MRKVHQIIVLTLGFLGTVCTAAEPMTYPSTRRELVRENYFGVTVEDPYRWLEETSSTEVIDWASAQSRFARAALDTANRKYYLRSLFKQVANEQRTPPVFVGKRVFNIFKPEGKDRHVLTWAESEDVPAKILLDINSWPRGQNLKNLNFDKNGKLIAYIASDDTEGVGTIQILNVDTGQVIDRIENFNVNKQFEIAPDGQGLYYIGTYELLYHKLGSPTKSDSPVIRSGQLPPGYSPQILSTSQNGHWLFIASNAVTIKTSHGNVYRRLYYAKNLAQSTPPIFFATSDLNGVSGDIVDSFDATDGFVYRFTRHMSPNGKILRIREDNIGSGQWVTWVPESNNLNLMSASIWSGYMFLNYLKDVSSQVLVKNLASGEISELKLPAFSQANLPSVQSPFYSYESLTTPLTFYRLDPKTMQSTLYLKEKSSIEPDQFSLRQVFVSSKDGTKVPMFILMKRDLALNGNTPFIVSGYGGFNEINLPTYQGQLVPWLKAGGGYALVNLRGGGEYGDQWHQAGMLHNKQNSFDDMIAAAEYLISHGYTKPAKLGVLGGSNGGLMVAAVVTQRPELFGAAVARVPLTDMIRFPKMGEGEKWIPEYGSPNSEQDFKSLYAYSPYHHISLTQKYPAMLFVTSFGDSRVTPIHAMKAVAALQANATTEKPILLRVLSEKGHFPTTIPPLARSLAETFGFFMDQLGLANNTKM